MSPFAFAFTFIPPKPKEETKQEEKNADNLSQWLEYINNTYYGPFPRFTPKTIEIILAHNALVQKKED